MTCVRREPIAHTCRAKKRALVEMSSVATAEAKEEILKAAGETLHAVYATSPIAPQHQICESGTRLTDGLAAGATPPLAPAVATGFNTQLQTAGEDFNHTTAIWCITLNLAQMGASCPARSGVQPPGHDSVAFKNHKNISILAHAAVPLVNFDTELQGGDNIVCYESETVGITLNLAQMGASCSARSGVQPPGHDSAAFKNHKNNYLLAHAAVPLVNFDTELQGGDNIVCYESKTVGITLNLAQMGASCSARSGVQPPGHDSAAFKNHKNNSLLAHAAVPLVNFDTELQGGDNIVCYESETVGITLNLAQMGVSCRARSGVQPPGHDSAAFKNHKNNYLLAHAAVPLVNFDTELQGGDNIVCYESETVGTTLILAQMGASCPARSGVQPPGHDSAAFKNHKNNYLLAHAAVPLVNVDTELQGGDNIVCYESETVGITLILAQMGASCRARSGVQPPGHDSAAFKNHKNNYLLAHAAVPLVNFDTELQGGDNIVCYESETVGTTLILAQMGASCPARSGVQPPGHDSAAFKNHKNNYLLAHAAVPLVNVDAELQGGDNIVCYESETVGTTLNLAQMGASCPARSGVQPPGHDSAAFKNHKNNYLLAHAAVPLVNVDAELQGGDNIVCYESKTVSITLNLAQMGALCPARSGVQPPGHDSVAFKNHRSTSIPAHPAVG